MKNEITIKNNKFQIIGYIETDEKGNKTVLDFYRRVLGYYDASTDTTRDFYRRVIARGDAAAMLLNQQ